MRSEGGGVRGERRGGGVRRGEGRGVKGEGGGKGDMRHDGVGETEGFIWRGVV